MRFIFFLSFGFHFLFASAQISKQTLFEYGNQVSTPYVDQIYTEDHNSYIATLQSMPTGAISRGIGITKIDPCGEIEWSNIYVKHAHPMDKAQIIQEKNSDNIFVTALFNWQGQKFIYVLKLDPNGNIIFSKYYDFGNYTLSYYYTNYATDNGLVISANYAPLGGGNGYTVIISIDSNGNLVHSHRFYHTFYGISCLQLSDQTYMHRTAQQLYVADVDGNVHWAIKYQSPNFFGNAFDILKVDDGYVMLVHHNSTYFLLKTNLTGQFIWKSDIVDVGLYPPQVIDNSKNQLLVCTYQEVDGDFKPLILTYNANGQLIQEDVINITNQNVSYLTSVSKSPNGSINLTYLNQINGSYSYIQDIENNICFTPYPYEIPLTENLIDTTYTLLPPQSFPLPSSGVYDVDLQIVDLFVQRTVYCNTPPRPDTLYTKVSIGCDESYTYTEDEENTTYFWHHDGSSDPTKTLDTVGVYQVDKENCYSKITEFITVESVCGCDIKIPNAFTPNGDLLNDVFEIQDPCGIEYFTIRIYDRWGKQLFKSNSITSSWDGTYNGNAVKSDLYHYQIEYTPLSSSSLVKTKQKDGVVLVLY